MSALLAGLAYVAIGRFFPNPSADARWWRLGAWALGAVVLVVQLLHECSRDPTASHVARKVAAGAALGGLGLVLWAMVRSGAVDGRWILALFAWPVGLAIPSFIVAYVGAILFQRFSR